VATPFSLKPVAYGADVVIQSLTKFVGGHGTTLGGVVIDGGTFRWAEHAERFPMFNCRARFPLVYVRDFPISPYALRCRTVGLRNEGAALPPFNAVLSLQALDDIDQALDA
jgi:O-acetylhomoserine (thiol)-lyase